MQGTGREPRHAARRTTSATAWVARCHGYGLFIQALADRAGDVQHSSFSAMGHDACRQRFRRAWARPPVRSPVAGPPQPERPRSSPATSPRASCSRRTAARPASASTDVSGTQTNPNFHAGDADLTVSASRSWVDTQTTDHLQPDRGRVVRALTLYVRPGRAHRLLRRGRKHDLTTTSSGFAAKRRSASTPGQPYSAAPPAAGERRHAVVQGGDLQSEAASMAASRASGNGRPVPGPRPGRHFVDKSHRPNGLGGCITALTGTGSRQMMPGVRPVRSPGVYV